MPRLQAEIDRARANYDAAARALEIAEAVLRALERVADTTAGIVRSSDAPAPEGKTRGKTPGAISGQWRAIMGRMVADGNRPEAPDVWAAAASALGYDLAPRAVNDWLRRASQDEHEYILRVAGRYRVSETAIEKFDLRPKPGITASDGGPKSSSQFDEDELI